MATIIKNKNELLRTREKIIGQKVGFVPTMGNLHKGHLSLVEKSLNESDVTTISIFVNPTQFGPNEDFESYPRTLEEDIEKICSVANPLNKKVYIFAPTDMSEVYPENFTTKFSIPDIENNLCGLKRPGHFQGVLSVIYHLFNLVHPHVAIFGQKDYQQFLLIKKFSEDMFPAIEIKSAPIVREDSGLAMSSRNNYLSNRERAQAILLRDTILNIQNKLLTEKSQIAGDDFIHESPGIDWDYLKILDAQTLTTYSPTESKKILIAGAMSVLKKVRIIDNILMENPHV